MPIHIGNQMCYNAQEAADHLGVARTTFVILRDGSDRLSPARFQTGDKEQTLKDVALTLPGDDTTKYYPQSALGDLKKQIVDL